MNNQEAIIAGVVKWMDSNVDIVCRCIERGAEKGIIAIAESVGSQLAIKGGRWMENNSAELVTAVAGQVSIGMLAEVPGMKAKLAGEPVSVAEKENKSDD